MLRAVTIWSSSRYRPGRWHQPARCGTLVLSAERELELGAVLGLGVRLLMSLFGPNTVV